MKRFSWILISVLLALASCHTPTREAKRMVRRAELLADTLPDSTVRLIDSVLRMPVYFGEGQRMDIALLQAEALFGCNNDTCTISPVMDDDFFDDHGPISTSPELEHAADYYAKKKRYDKAAHAALYSGFVQQHYNEKEAAMRSFKEAEQYGGIVFDSLTLALAQYRMGRMLYYDEMEKEAVILFLTADNNFNNRYADRALVQNMLSSCHIILGNYEKAETALKLSLDYAEKANSSTLKVYALNNYAVLYRLQEKYELAIDYLRQSIMTKDFDETIKLSLYLNLGKTFVDQEKLDSAAFYFNQIETLLPTSNAKEETKISAFGTLSRFAESQGDLSKALEYRKQYEIRLDKVVQDTEQKSIYSIQKKYDYESLQNTMNQQLARKQRIIAISIVLLLCVVTLFLYRSSQRNKREAEANANLFHFMEQNKALVESNIAHEKKVLDTTQQLSDLLYARLKAMQKLDYCLKTPKDKIALKDLEKDVFGTGDHWEAIKEVLVSLYPGLWETLKLKYPNMDEMELRVCMLAHLRLSRLAEATLLGISTSVLDKLRTKVRKTMEQAKKQ